ncbi:cardiolipin synthase [Bacillus niameyensis]|uniref:cardiolipin synthase n=1 Tax=Bacillus niameyensis TaxID=1522308 RepID=UPI000781E415|nr:cardiolipin synthase [Bacillus niameyensis]
MRWLFGIVFILIFITIGGYVDFLLGRLSHQRHYKKQDYPLRFGDLQLITSGPDLYRTYFQDLKKAHSSIQIIFYIVQNDHFSNVFFEILKEQAEKGIQIHLLLDQIGSRKVPKKWFDQAQLSGIKISFCHRLRFPFFFFSLQQRNHRKVTIIDGKIGYLGGYNIGMEYIDLDPKLTPWRDYHIRLKGEGVADLQQEFWLDWNKATGERLKREETELPYQGRMVHKIFPTVGIGLEEVMIEHIHKAQTTIIIGTPYFIPPKNIFLALIKALERGVDVKVLVPKTSDHPIVKEASFRYLRQLLDLGCSVYHFQNGFYHAKVLVIDDDFCDIGTANFDYRSMLINYEINCFIYDKTFISEVEATLAEDMNQSEKLSLEGLKKVGVLVRMKEWVGWIIKGLL